MLLDMLLIAVCCVIVIDITGFPDAVTSMIKRWMTDGKLSEPFELKPFTCSLCSSWWLCLAWCILTHNVTLLAVTTALLVAVSTPVINAAIRALLDLAMALINKINILIEKLDK